MNNIKLFYARKKIFEKVYPMELSQIILLSFYNNKVKNKKNTPIFTTKKPTGMEDVKQSGVWKSLKIGDRNFCGGIMEASFYLPTIWCKIKIPKVAS